MRFTIKMKLGLSFGLITVLLVGASYLGISSLSNLKTSMDDVITGPLDRESTVKKVKIEIILPRPAGNYFRRPGDNPCIVW